MKNAIETSGEMHFAGISLDSAGKGFHVCVIDDDGTVTDLVRLKTAESVSRYLKHLRPQCIAVDGPSCSISPVRKRYEAEFPVQAIDSGGAWSHVTEERHREWMLQSRFLWSILRGDFPDIPICETLPAAVQDRVLTEEARLPLSMMQSRILRGHVKDFFDSILAAVAAKKIYHNEAEIFGIDDEPGPVYLPSDPFRDYTLCVPVQSGKVLLGRKKRGLGEGYWNGFGGKVEAEETIGAAAIRELFEEVNLKARVRDLVPAGLLYFTFDDPSTHPIRGTVFRLETFSGNPEESEEMSPRWFAEDAIPYDQMWGDDTFWFPLLLEKRPFVASFHVGPNNSIVRRTVVETEAVFAMIQRGKSRRPRLSI